MNGDVTWTIGAEIVQWDFMTCGTREIRFDTMIEVFIGSTDIFAEHS